jgi:hypothetical protein
VFGERHLRHVLLSYMNSYNETRTHLSLDKDAPLSHTVQRAGRILRPPILGGLHHQYVRIDLQQAQVQNIRQVTSPQEVVSHIRNANQHQPASSTRHSDRGAYGSRLKIRPPLCFSQENADMFVTACEDEL